MLFHDPDHVVLSAAYLLLLLGALFVIYHRLKVFGKFNLGVLFAVEVAVQSSVRITYFFLGMYGNTWAKVTHLPHGPSYMLFIDLFPELLFFDMYLLLVVTWGVTWLKSKGMKPFSVSQILVVYSIIVAILFLVSAGLAWIARLQQLSIDKVVLWEVLYLVLLTLVSILVTALAGLKLYFTLGNKRYVDNNYIKYMRRISIIIIFTSASFALKGAWAYSFSDLVRGKWEDKEISNTAYSASRFSYYFLSELLPEATGLVFRFLNSRARSKMNEFGRKRESKPILNNRVERGYIN